MYHYYLSIFWPNFGYFCFVNYLTIILFVNGVVHMILFLHNWCIFYFLRTASIFKICNNIVVIWHASWSQLKVIMQKFAHVFCIKFITVQLYLCRMNAKSISLNRCLYNFNIKKMQQNGHMWCYFSKDTQKMTHLKIAKNRCKKM